LGANGSSMGNAAARPPTLQHGVFLFQKVATQRHLATDTRPNPSATADDIRSRGTVPCGYCRFSIAQALKSLLPIPISLIYCPIQNSTFLILNSYFLIPYHLIPVFFPLQTFLLRKWFAVLQPSRSVWCLSREAAHICSEPFPTSSFLVSAGDRLQHKFFGRWWFCNSADSPAKYPC